MAIAVLRFDLQEPDDERGHRFALAGRDALLNLDEISSHIRSRIKYAVLSSEAEAELQAVRDLIDGALLDLIES